MENHFQPYRRKVSMKSKWDNDISAGARESVQWAVDSGVLTGTPSKIKPNGPTRRDQCAAVLGRFYKRFEQ